MTDKLLVNVHQTIRQIKAMESGMYVTYSFPDAPEGVYFMHQRDLIALAEKYEQFEKAILEIHNLVACEGGCKSLAAAALDEVACNETNNGKTTNVYERLGIEGFDPQDIADQLLKAIDSGLD